MKVSVPLEQDPTEWRVAATPRSIKKLLSMDFEVLIASGAGLKAEIADVEYESAGAVVVSNDVVCDGADVILTVTRPSHELLSRANKGALLIGSLDPYGDKEELKKLVGVAGGLSCFSLELMPRITRAQGMDVLSSQSSLIGYQAIIDAACEYNKVIPMMMTPAGTLAAARIFVMGVGVAGLQAIATAKRLGGVVTATDVRSAVKEQVLSLGAKFIAVEDEEFQQAETSGGYAKTMSLEYQEKQAELIAEHIKKQDIVITTALIPGRPAPVLVKSEMVKSMSAGSVIVDLAVLKGGNVEGSVSGQVVVVNGVRIVGYTNVASRVAASASQLYANNLLAFLEILVDKNEGAIKVDWQDELVVATAIARDGKVLGILSQE